MKKSTILHITPHFGGGVGRVLLNYFAKVKDDPSFVHKAACLDYANDKALSVTKDIGLNLTDRMASNVRELLAMIAKADVVLIHWWNHPLLYDFLVRTELPPCRVVMWSHISGFHPPYVFTGKIFRYPDLFVFTTPVSYETKEVRFLSDGQKKSLRVVWSTGGVEHVEDIKPKLHKGFTVGYVGTVDYCKMHPEFLNMCSKIDIPGVNFIVCGGPKENEIRKEAERLGIAGKFNFTGLVPDITKYLPLFDVFGYPLASYHYGTCDQALAESMVCGIVPVVLSNRMENQMVKDGVTGIVVKNKDEYCNAIMKLYGDKGLKAALSENAKAYARKTFSLEVLRQEWEKIFREVLSFPKTVRKWEIDKHGAEISPKDVFLESLGEYGQEFILYCNATSPEEREIHSKKIKELAQSPIWQAQTRGTIYHYNEFFPDDVRLSEWSKLMGGSELNNKKGER